MSLPFKAVGPEKSQAPNLVKVLLLDDSTFDRARIRRLSHKTALMVDITEVSSIAEIKVALAREVFDLILIDYRLPQGDGLEVLAYIQDSPLNHDAATIMITGDGDMETAVAAMRNGCHDFLAKGAMTADQLGVAMTGAMQTAAAHRDLVAQSAHQRDIIRQGLTEALLNRDVQNTVASLFKEQFRQIIGAHSAIFASQEHNDLDAVLASLQDNDEFIFN